MGSTRGQPGVNLGSTWGQLGVNLGSTWGEPRVNLQHPTASALSTPGELWRARRRGGGSSSSSCASALARRARRRGVGSSSSPSAAAAAAAAAGAAPTSTLGLRLGILGSLGSHDRSTFLTSFTSRSLFASGAAVTFMARQLQEARLCTAQEARLSACGQGLKLVHFSAQLERFVWDRGCA